MNYVIISGASRGVGRAIAAALLRPDNALLCVSRQQNRALLDEATALGGSLEFIAWDLSDPGKIEALIDELFAKIDRSRAQTISLVNNAGVVSPIHPLPDCQAGAVVYNIQLNLIAPMLMTAQFIRRTADWPIEKRVVNISSGAGRKAYYGWASYCAAKAGVDLFSQCVGLEQQEAAFPVKIVSLAPGIVDTDMQQELRAAHKEDFAQVERFRKLKEEGRLLQPEFVAEKVVELLLRQNFPSGSLLDVTEWNADDQ
ncbi:MAG: (S)-benzoin forming benzil reductase [Peptococcaceae bacterium]|nr:(S)-benzoin forming benzil reductase [Peptococcaceae bacterium]